MAKLLIVDDEAGIVEEIKLFFQEEGHQVYTADSGEDGIALMRGHLPDLLLIDVKLPDISGLKVLAAAKEISPKSKTIVITGYVDQALIDEAEKIGRDAFIQKPFNLETLKNEVDRLLGAHPTSDSNS